MVVQNISDYTVPEEALTLFNMCQRLLDTVVEEYETAGLPLPERRYWTFGRPAEDCAQVVVSFLQSYLGAPGDQAATPQRCNGVKSAVFNISITRDFPIGTNGKAVPPAKIMDANAWNAVDTQMLLNMLEKFDAWEDNYPGLGVIATVNAADAGGGLSTVNLNLTLAIG